MSKTNCEVIRRELDELMLGETCSAAALEHLRECAACREFNEKQTRLRQIVGGLGTVSAPPDFDFRLRARLANDANGAAAFHFWPAVRRGLAFAVVLFLVLLGALLVRNVFNRAPANKQVATTDQHNNTPAPQPSQTAIPKEEPKPAPELFAAAPERHPQTIKTSQTGSRIKRTLASEDFSSQRAPVFNGVEPAGAFEVLPLDSSQSFKVSLDDGRGNARTISVPSLSFGSQRMLQTGNQYVSKRDW